MATISRGTVGLLITLMVLCFAAEAFSKPQFGEWERKNSVYRKGNWIVVRQAPGDCYAKSGDGEFLSLTIKPDLTPILFVPEMNAVHAYSYWVDDDGPKIVSGLENQYPLRMPKELTARLKTGKKLHLRISSRYPDVKYEPKIQVTRHEISLRGLRGALKAMSKGRCAKP